MSSTTRALSAVFLLATTLAGVTLWTAMAGKGEVGAALVASAPPDGEEHEGAVMVESWSAPREEAGEEEVAPPLNRPGLVGEEAPRALPPQVLRWQEVLADERLSVCRLDAQRACRLVVELGIPLEPERLVEATVAADLSAGYGVLETLRVLIRSYGGRRLWERAETAEQKRALRGILMDENDLSELLDAPLGEVRSW